MQGTGAARLLTSLPLLFPAPLPHPPCLRTLQRCWVQGLPLQPSQHLGRSWLRCTASPLICDTSEMHDGLLCASVCCWPHALMSVREVAVAASTATICKVSALICCMKVLQSCAHCCGAPRSGGRCTPLQITNGGVSWACSHPPCVDHHLLCKKVYQCSAAHSNG